VGCISNPNSFRKEFTEWKIANDLNGNPTKIQWRIATYFNDGGIGRDHVGVCLYNGYDNPVEIYYKIYFGYGETENTQTGYLNAHNEMGWYGVGWLGERGGPQNVEIIKIENK
jgi:hypothetical protein